MLTYSFLWEVRINQCKHSVIFVGHRQTADPDQTIMQRLLGVFTDCLQNVLIKLNRNGKYHPTPLNWKWARPSDKVGKFIRLIWVKYLR